MKQCTLFTLRACARMRKKIMRDRYENMFLVEIFEDHGSMIMIALSI